MPTGKTARRSLPYLEPTDAPKLHETGQLLAAALDNDVEGGQGTLAERPAAKLRGRVYTVQGDATAVNNGILWWDTGATWVPISPGLVVALHAASFTAAPGERVIATANGITVTLPTPTANAVIEVWYAESSGQVTVTASSGAIAGDFVSGSSLKLTANQHVCLVGDGTFWRIVAGEPKREQAWSALKSFTKAEAEAGQEVSATRPGYVLFKAAGGTPGLEIGGVKVEAIAGVPTTYLPGRSGNSPPLLKYRQSCSRD
jgi:hypothetical protein